MHLDAMCFKDFRGQRLYHTVASMLTGEMLGDLASAGEYATDAAIAKLVKEREMPAYTASTGVFL